MIMREASCRSTSKALLVAAALLLPFLVAGCGNSDGMSQNEVEYLSHMDQARFFQRQGELKASTQEARSAMAARPEEAEPYFVLINNLLTAGDGVSAERQIDQLRKGLLTGDEVPVEILNSLWILQAHAQLLQQNYAEVQESLNKLQDPDEDQQVKAWVLKGDAYRKQEKYSEAESAYQAALELKENAVMPILGLSRVAYHSGNKEKAREQLELAKEIDPEDPEVWLWKGEMAHREGNLNVAHKSYTRALEDIGRYDVMTHQKYTTISALIDVLQRKGDASQAFVYEEILANSAPGTIRSNLEAARKHYEKGDLDRAGNYLTEVLKHAPEHQNASILLGMIRFQQGRAEEAEKLLAPYADLAESDELTKMLAAARIQLQRPEEAREMLEKLDPHQSDPGVVALIGIASLASGDHELGQGLIEQSLKAAPANASLRARYARYLLSQNDTDRAISHLKTGMEKSPEADSLRILLTQVYLQTDNPEAAQNLTAEWRREQPDNIRAISTSGDVAQALGDTEQARKFYQQSLKVDPSAGESHFALGGLEARSGNTQKAIGHFQDALKNAPENEQAMNALFSLTRQDEDTLAETMAFLNQLIDTHKDAIRPRLALLEYHLQRLEMNKANSIANNIERRLDDDARAAVLVGSVYHGVARRALTADNLDQARRVITAGRERYRHHEELALADARLQFQRERPRDARDILRIVKTQYPDSALPYLTEADYLMRQGQHRQAVEQYKLAREKQDSPDTLARMAFAKRQGGQTGRSIALLESGVQKFGENEQILLSLAMTYQADGEDEKSIDAYQRTLRAAPNNVVALNNLAWLYHEKGHEDAQSLAERAYQLNPNSAEVADTYGWILFNQGKIEEGIRILEQAHRMAPDSKDISNHLTEAYKAAGRDEDAQALSEQI